MSGVLNVLPHDRSFENILACDSRSWLVDGCNVQGYSVAFDPLDGSSIIDTNFAVGTIFGVWPGSRLVGVSGRDLSAAGMAVYGPRTTMTIAGTCPLCFCDASVGSHLS